MNRWRITIGVSVFLALVLAVIGWHWLFPPLPDEQDLIALYAAHKQEFTSLTTLMASHCSGRLTPEATTVANRIDRRMRVVCDYDGTMRIILGVHGLMTIGPERIIGFTYIPGDPARKGRVVSVLGSYKQDVGNVYLRQVDSHWYVFTQNTD